ncbi:MAG: pyruvate dehydrogenase complex dihydrolipoamide acetyltransferase [Archangium sp.]|nr:pyruvate dehydrogenase complex dihydrolipoamide acetyltransferase [Archangium sp.]MDP3155400.1 pyruvate dehydrogenase complex dihydrolipoamide acetyltransferase [Archangium sp.]MDP3573732.1 pyruvate dehydrogenase complex dihydrolipoamide acetyltransferase [Archangium sp.]
MPIAIQLPALSPTMSEGRITKWLKKEGDKVNSGDGLAECETDKSNLEIEATDGGTLLKIVVPAGSTSPVGGVIGWIGKPGEAIPEAPAPAAAPAAPAPVAAAPKPAPAAPAASAVPPKPAPKPVAAAPVAGEERLRVSPLARKMAETQGIDLASVPGSGPNGRIVKRDVEEAMASPAPAAKKSAPIVRAAPGVRQAPQDIALTSMRKVIAQRLGEVKPGVPHFYLTIEVEMDQALKLREEAKAQDLKISVNDVLVKATAMAVRKFPRINQFFAGDRIVQLNTVDVGVAVAIEDGLITPIIKDADVKGLAEIAQEVRELADRAKKKALKPEEYTGGSITVSNLGMFGIDSFIAVINPPQAAILAVGKVEPKVVVRNDAMVIRQMMSVTLSGDHRVIDGAVGAQYLQELRSLLEHPLRLLF